jgi:hypothetical protein
MSVDVKIVDVRDMIILSGRSPGKPTRVNRLRCDASGNLIGVYAKWYRPGKGPAVGDRIRWQDDRIWYHDDRRWVKKVGQSVNPSAERSERPMSRTRMQ